MSALIGIDVGGKYTKVVYAEHKGKMHVRQAFSFLTPFKGENTVLNLDADNIFKKIISEIPLQKLKKSLIGITLPSSLVKVLTVSLPKMNKRELNIAAAAEAKRRIVPPPGPKSIFDNVILGEIIVGKVPRYETLVIKTDKEYIETILGIFNKDSDITPVFISPTCYSLCVSLSPSQEEYAKDSVFVDIGFDSIDIIISRDRGLHFYRDIKFGLKNIIQHISKELNISAEKAEVIIGEKGVPQVDIDLSDRVKVAEEIMRQKYEAFVNQQAEQEINDLELRMAWQGDIDNIIHEIRRSLMYYKEQSQGRRAENIYFLGGGAKIKGLVPILTKEFGGHCRTFDPIEAMGIVFDKAHVPQMAEDAFVFSGALSLAVSISVERKTKSSINFLPQELKTKEVVARRKVLAVITGICLLLSVVSTASKFAADNHGLRMSIANMEKEMSLNSDVSAHLARLKDTKGSIEVKVEKIRNALENRIISADVLEKISQLVPEGILLNDAFIASEGVMNRINEGQEGIRTLVAGQVASARHDYRIIIKGSCMADYETAMSLAEKFSRRLEQSAYFREIKLNPPELEKIVPRVGEDNRVVLTETVKREFSLEAELAKVRKR